MNLGIELLQFHTEHSKIYKPYKDHEGLTKRESKKAYKGEAIRLADVWLAPILPFRLFPVVT